MKLSILISILLLSTTLSSGNDLKSKLQGSWLCTKIVDENGNPTSGKFGNSDEYLKFVFKKNLLAITESAFDPSNVGFTIKYGQDYIDLIPGSVYKIPEQVYQIEDLTSDFLRLKTLSQNGDTIRYHFINENKILSEFDSDSTIVDGGLIIIKHLKLSGSAGFNRLSQYYIPNSIEYLNPSPVFNHPKFGSFGHYVSNNFKFPKTYPLDSISDELIIDFKIFPGEVDEVKISKSLDPDMDKQMVELIKRTSKKWKPLNLKGAEITCSVRFHFVFYLAKMGNFEFGN